MVESNLSTLLAEHVVDSDASLEQCVEAYFYRFDLQKDLLAHAGNQKVSAGCWSNGCNLGSTNTVEYTMPPQIGVPKNRVTVTLKFTRVIPGELYEIDQYIRSPDLPIVGGCFQVILRTIIQNCNKGVKISISQEVDFFKKSLLKSVVKRNARAEGIRFYSKVWIPFMNSSFCSYLTTDICVEEEQKEQESTDVLPQCARSRAFSIFIADKYSHAAIASTC
mmetsp:Transcript_12079/g.13892  ORF Transcript_12079/g.13892 Transcript_12079/m.13892 type:complete len:221 (-) Transcript_12079:114-776(-)